MRAISAASLLVLIVAANSALGADPFVWGAGPTAPKTGDAAAPAGGADEKQKVSEMQTLFSEGKYDDVLKAGAALLRSAKGEDSRTEACRLVAEATRKKGDWKAAVAAYSKLRDRYDKTSDDYARNDATAEVLRASPAGVYPPMAAAAAAAAAGGGSKTLADDAGLAEALLHVAEGRAAKLKARIPAIKRARSPQEVVALYEPLAVELRQLRGIAPTLSPEAEQQAAAAAAERMAELGRQVIATLTAKQAEFQQAIADKRLTSSQKRDMEKYQGLCNELAKIESSFQAVLAKVGGSADNGRATADSADRQQAYKRLAPQFTPPTDSTTSQWGNWINWW